MLNILRGLTNIPPNFPGCIATIGNFDGVHLGHQAIIRQLVEKSRELNLPSVLIIFEPQPNEFFASGKEAIPARLMRFSEKWKASQPLSLDYLLCLHFNQKLANLSPEAFVEKILVQHLKVKHLLVGDDFRFGKQRAGDINTLRDAAEKWGFTVGNLLPYKIGNTRVSSTNIRLALKAGDLETACALLGRDYSISGQVIHGDKRGRIIGFPTANIFLHRKTVPLTGVYAVKIKGILGKVLYGVANIGTRPTVDDTKCLLEIHIFDFNEDIYGQHICVAFVKKLRDEKRYDSFELLRQQILKDAKEAMECFGLH